WGPTPAASRCGSRSPEGPPHGHSGRWRSRGAPGAPTNVTSLTPPSLSAPNAAQTCRKMPSTNWNAEAWASASCAMTTAAAPPGNGPGDDPLYCSGTLKVPVPPYCVTPTAVLPELRPNPTLAAPDGGRA